MGDWRNIPESRSHGILCAETGVGANPYLWDVADFHENLEERVSIEQERVLRGLCAWSVSQVRAGELAVIVEEHKAAIVDLRAKIKETEKTGKALEKRLHERQEMFAPALADDALESERKAAEEMLRDLQYRVDRVPREVGELEGTIARHQAFIDQLAGIIASLRAVERPLLPDWLQAGA